MNMVLKPVEGKVTPVGDDAWMVSVGKTMRQFAEGIKLPPKAGALRAKAIKTAITNPLAAAAQAAAAAAAAVQAGMGLGGAPMMVGVRVGATGGGRGGYGRGGTSAEQRRLAAQGRAAPY